MARFRDLARQAQASWSETDHEIYERASAAFKEEAEAQIAFGKNLCALRNEQHWGQSYLADLTGIQQSEISRIERGAANPTLATVAKLAKAFGKELKIV